MQKTCRHCQNMFPEEEHQNHELNCAVNPDVQEKARKVGEVETFKKTAVIEGGKVVRMYWAHSMGADAIDMDPIFNAWRQINPKVDYNSVPFLRSRGFKVLIT